MEFILIDSYFWSNIGLGGWILHGKIGAIAPCKLEWFVSVLTFC